jgi:hypothetical protein
MLKNNNTSSFFSEGTSEQQAVLPNRKEEPFQ